MKKAIFTIDSHPSFYVGYTNGQRWNGWEMPYFDKKTTMRIIAELQDGACDSAFHWDGDTLIENDLAEGESFEVGTTTIDGVTYYRIGDGWVWEMETRIEGAVFVKDLTGRGFTAYADSIDWAMSNIEDTELVEWLTSAGVGDEYTTDGNERIEVIK